MSFWVGLRVKMDEGSALRVLNAQTPLQGLPEGLSDLRGFLDQFPERLRRLVLDEHRDHLIADLQENSALQKLSRLHEVLLLSVDTREEAKALRDKLRVLEGVSSAWVRREVQPASSVPWPASAGAKVHEQDFLDYAPTGVGARFSHAQSFKNGAGIQFADVEFGWSGHDDFVSALPAVIPAGRDQSREDQQHGVNALGIVLANAKARGNDDGAVGVAPGAALVALGSVFDSSTAVANGSVVSKASGVTRPTADTIYACVAAGAKLILIEIEAGGLPVEVNPDTRLAIQHAVAKGVTVIEPAGNGTGNALTLMDLDEVQDGAGHYTLNRFGPEAEDSGAILVGAVEPTSSAKNSGTTRGNYGSRVDCHASGNRVLTTGSPVSLTSDYAFFSGTSAASAIIAGVALSYMSQSKVTDPAAVRRALRDVRNGSRAREAAVWLGPMPDLRRLLADQPRVETPVFHQDRRQDAPRLGKSRAMRVSGRVLQAVSCSTASDLSNEPWKLEVLAFAPCTVFNASKAVAATKVDALGLSGGGKTFTPAWNPGIGMALPPKSFGFAVRAYKSSAEPTLANWSVHHLMDACRKHPFLSAFNVHTLTGAAGSESFDIGGLAAKPYTLDVFCPPGKTVDLKLGTGTQTLKSGDRIVVAPGPAHLGWNGAQGDVWRLVQSLHGREVGAIEWRLP
jgi:hypothetical protein